MPQLVEEVRSFLDKCPFKPPETWVSPLTIARVVLRPRRFALEFGWLCLVTAKFRIALRPRLSLEVGRLRVHHFGQLLLAEWLVVSLRLISFFLCGAFCSGGSSVLSALIEGKCIFELRFHIAMRRLLAVPGLVLCLVLRLPPGPMHFRG